MESVLPERLVVGYHGCDADVAARLLAGEAFIPSERAYDWLGRGVYFWEYGYERALRWACEAVERDRARPPKHRAPILTPAVVGAVNDLADCFDLLDTKATDALAEFYPAWEEARCSEGLPLPMNRAGLHYLDCAVLNTFLSLAEAQNERPYTAVRGVFFEGDPVYAGSAIRCFSHIQIAVRRSEACFRRLFDPILRMS